MTDPARGARAGRLALWIGPVSLLGSGLAMMGWTWRAWPDPIVDFGREVYVAWRLAEGDVLFRDVAWFNGPLSPHWNALLFRLFGPGLMTLAAANLVVLAATVAILWRLLTRLAGRFVATAGGLVFLTVFAFGQHVGFANYNWVCPYSHELTHGLSLALASVASLDAWHRTRHARWLASAGAALGLAFLTKPEPTLAAIAAAAIYLLPAVRRTPRAPALFAAAAAAPIVASIALLALALPPAQALRGTLGAWPSLFQPELAALPFYRAGLGLDRPEARFVELLAWTGRWLALLAPAVALAFVRRGSPAASRPLAAVAAALVVVLLAAAHARTDWLSAGRPLPLFALAIGAALVLAARRGRPLAPSPLAPAFAIFSLVLLAKMILHARIIHYGFVLAAPATLLLVAALLRWLPAALDRSGAHGIVFRAAAVALLAWGVGEHLLVTRFHLARKTVTVASGRDAFRADLRGRFANDALALVRELAPASLAVVPEGVMLNYLARIPNPTPYVSFQPPERILFGENAWLDAFRTRPPDVILVVHADASEYGVQYFGRDWARDLAGWIQSRYAPGRLLGDEPLVPGSRFGIRALVRDNTVLFRSGFERDVVIDPPFVRGGQQWRTISGVDETTGFSWSELPGKVLGFQPLIAPESDASLHVEDRIVTVLGHDGDSTRVLEQIFRSDDPAFPGRSRSNYLFTPDERMVDAVQSWWVFLQPDLRDVMAPPGTTYNNWRQLWEMKCGPRADSFRINVAIGYTPKLGLHWGAGGEHGPFDGTGKREFRFVDDRIEVPVGRWFELEIRLKQHPTDGRFTCRIDGETLCDWSGKTMNESYVQKWTLVKLDTNPARMGGPHWQYVDDIELRAVR